MSQHVISSHISRIRIPNILGDPVKQVGSFLVPTTRERLATENASLSGIHKILESYECLWDYNPNRGVLTVRAVSKLLHESINMYMSYFLRDLTAD